MTRGSTMAVKSLSLTDLWLFRYCDVASEIRNQVGVSQFRPNLTLFATFTIAPNWAENPAPLTARLFSKPMAVIKDPGLLLVSKKYVLLSYSSAWVFKFTPK